MRTQSIGRQMDVEHRKPWKWLWVAFGALSFAFVSGTLLSVALIGRLCIGAEACVDRHPAKTVQASAPPAKTVTVEHVVTVPRTSSKKSTVKHVTPAKKKAPFNVVSRNVQHQPSSQPARYQLLSKAGPCGCGSGSWSPPARVTHPPQSPPVTQDQPGVQDQQVVQTVDTQTISQSYASPDGSVGAEASGSSSVSVNGSIVINGSIANSTSSTIVVNGSGCTITEINGVTTRSPGCP
jgi:hypothetical protein